MTISRRVLCVVYALVGLVALVGTWGNNIDYLDLGIVGANIHFWQETLVNPASRSITVDILCLALAAIVWMLLEARRLSMRGAWLWVLLRRVCRDGRRVSLVHGSSGTGAGKKRAVEQRGNPVGGGHCRHRARRHCGAGLHVPRPDQVDTPSLEARQSAGRQPAPGG